MGPNPIKLEEELLDGCALPEGSVVCDLGSGQGLTSVFLVKEYGFTVYAADLWSDPDENRAFFDSMGVDREKLIPVKADATDLKFEPEFFDGIVSTDSYNYFGRDPHYLDDKLLPFVKKGGLIYICIPGMKKDLHDDLPPELLLSWTPEQLGRARTARPYLDRCCSRGHPSSSPICAIRIIGARSSVRAVAPRCSRSAKWRATTRFGRIGSGRRTNTP